MISRTRRAFVSSARPELLTKVASCAPAAVLGHVAFSSFTTRLVGWWCDALVLVTSCQSGSFERRPVPWQPGHVLELPPKELVMRPSPPHTLHDSDSIG